MVASRNSVKVYADNSFYHIYNRGVEQRPIFTDEQDYAVFLSYIKTYILPKNALSLQAILLSNDSSAKDKDKALKLLNLKNYSADLELICFALLPNHFHLLIKQRKNVINSFMNSLGTRYAMYFNRKHRRKGVLFQDVYKAVLVENAEQLLHLSRYIHLNPLRALKLKPSQWENSPFPCSLHEYLNKRQTDWIKKDHVLDFFSKLNTNGSYADFMQLAVDNEFIQPLLIDDNVD